MNYLSICQRVHEIAGFQGQFNTVDTTGYQAVITQAVQDAYEDIQRYRPEWQFTKLRRDVNVSDAATEYPLDELWGTTETSDLASYRYINWYDSAKSRNHRLIEINYDTWQFQKTDRNPGEPRAWAMRPWDKALLITPVDKVYTLTIHYVRDLDELTQNTSVPLIPQRHHQLIVYGALLKVSTFIGNPTLFDTYSLKYAEEMGQLMREENPARVVTKRPIA